MRTERISYFRGAASSPMRLMKLTTSSSCFPRGEDQPLSSMWEMQVIRRCFCLMMMAILTASRTPRISRWRIPIIPIAFAISEWRMDLFETSPMTSMSWRDV